MFGWTENSCPGVSVVRSPEKGPLNGTVTVAPAATVMGGRPGGVEIVREIGEPVMETNVAPRAETLIPNVWVFVIVIVPTTVPVGLERWTTCEMRATIERPESWKIRKSVRRMLGFATTVARSNMESTGSGA